MSHVTKTDPVAKYKSSSAMGTEVGLSTYGVFFSGSGLAYIRHKTQCLIDKFILLFTSVFSKLRYCISRQTLQMFHRQDNKFTKLSICRFEFLGSS